MDKQNLPPRGLDVHGKKRNFIFCKILNFKPHDENGLSLWCGSTRKDGLENNGHEQARLFMKSFDASFRKLLAITHFLEMKKNLSKEMTMKL